MSRWPARIRDASGRTVFTQRPDLHATRQEAGGPVPAGARAVMPDEAGVLYVVCQGPPPAPPSSSMGPVYEAEAGGPLAVPTGRVLVRLAEGQAAGAAREQFAAVGFVLERALPYAPHAAWLRAARGDIASALAALEDLRSLPDVVHVEPQMLLERTPKHT